MSQSYLLFDPQHPQAVALMEAVYRRTKLRAVCLYPSRLQELRHRKHFPMLRSSMVEASYLLDTGTLPSLARVLRQRHDLVGAVPHQHTSLEMAAELLQALDLPWNDAALLRRVRDRHAVKDYLRNHHPRLPVPEARLVRSANDVFEAPRPARFVIKPNQSAGHGEVAFFQANTPRAQIAAYFMGTGRRGAAVLEEVLQGTEYTVYGQLDPMGRATVVHVVQHERAAHSTHHVPRTDPAFAELSLYATEVMQALGLRRCPFQVQVMQTPHGPRLMDVGVRLANLAEASLANTVHGGQFDALALAAHHYLFDSMAADTHFDWQHYDRIGALHLDGHINRAQRIYQVEGVREVEMMPEFTRWLQQPRVGDSMPRTVDGQSAAYAVQLRTYGSHDELLEARAHVQRVIRINRQVSAPRRLGVAMLANLRALKWRSHFLMARALGT